MDDIKNRVASLRKDLEEHNHAYYVLSTPMISDRVYDEMMQELQ